MTYFFHYQRAVLILKYRAYAPIYGLYVVARMLQASWGRDGKQQHVLHQTPYKP